MCNDSSGNFYGYATSHNYTCFIGNVTGIGHNNLIFLNHKVPLTAGATDVQLCAAQLRAALTDRLSLTVGLRRSEDDKLVRIEYNAGNLSVSQDPALTPMNGLSISETLRRIEECESWMALKLTAL